MGCVVAHPATANAATIASISGRFVIFCISIEFLIVIPLTDFGNELRAGKSFLATKSRLRGTILTDKLRYLSGRFRAPTPIACICAFDGLTWTNHGTGMRDRATLRSTLLKFSTAAPHEAGARLLGLVLNLLATALDVPSESVHCVTAGEQRDQRDDSYGKKSVHHDHLPQGKRDDVSRKASAPIVTGNPTPTRRLNVA
jgi:hypothetical protein